MATLNFAAVDLGAESGRVMRGSLAGGLLQIAEAHRFVNGPLQQGESLRWDFAKILAGVKRGIALAPVMVGGPAGASVLNVASEPYVVPPVLVATSR